MTALGLSRYVDLGRDGCGTVSDTPHHRAIAESGWDNTTRFGDDATRVIPVDLNAQLYRYENDLAELYHLLDQPGGAAAWQRRAHQRRELINRWLWVDPDGPTPGRYRPLRGFGWTNSVFLTLIARLLFDAHGRPSRALPDSWQQARLRPAG